MGKALKYYRKFIGFFSGQSKLIEAEHLRRSVSQATIVREIFDLGVPKYRKLYKLPPTYPSNGLIDFTNDKNF